MRLLGGRAGPETGQGEAVARVVLDTGRPLIEAARDRGPTAQHKATSHVAHKPANRRSMIDARRTRRSCYAVSRRCVRHPADASATAMCEAWESRPPLARARHLLEAPRSVGCEPQFQRIGSKRWKTRSTRFWGVIRGKHACCASFAYQCRARQRAALPTGPQ